MSAPKVILVSGASSGFGAMTVRALADAKHVVYGGMRDLGGRNARPPRRLGATPTNTV
jgi:NADP-dependent 3-hydroxy acid dehydrogenase YdfG